MPKLKVSAKLKASVLAAFAAVVLIGPLQHIGAIPQTAVGDASKAVLKSVKDTFFPPAFAACGVGEGFGPIGQGGSDFPGTPGLGSGSGGLGGGTGNGGAVAGAVSGGSGNGGGTVYSPFQDPNAGSGATNIVLAGTPTTDPVSGAGQGAGGLGSGAGVISGGSAGGRSGGGTGGVISGGTNVISGTGVSGGSGGGAGGVIPSGAGGVSGGGGGVASGGAASGGAASGGAASGGGGGFGGSSGGSFAMGGGGGAGGAAGSSSGLEVGQFMVIPPAAGPGPFRESDKLKQRVLIVDAAEDSRESDRALLQLNGYSVMTAANAREGMKNFEWFLPNVVLIDRELPGAVDLVRNVRKVKVGSSAVLVALAAQAREQERRDSIAAGFDGYLAKPLKVEELHQVIALVARRHRTTETAMRDQDRPARLVLSTAGRPSYAPRGSASAR